MCFLNVYCYPYLNTLLDSIVDLKKFSLTSFLQIYIIFTRGFFAYEKSSIYMDINAIFKTEEIIKFLAK